MNLTEQVYTEDKGPVAAIMGTFIKPLSSATISKIIHIQVAVTTEGNAYYIPTQSGERGPATDADVVSFAEKHGLVQTDKKEWQHPTLKVNTASPVTKSEATQAFSRATTDSLFGTIKGYGKRAAASLGLNL
jgi:hypothetical protein